MVFEKRPDMSLYYTQDTEGQLVIDQEKYLEELEEMKSEMEEEQSHKPEPEIVERKTHMAKKANGNVDYLQ